MHDESAPHQRPGLGRSDLHSKIAGYESIEPPADVERIWKLFNSIKIPAEPDLDAAARAIAFGNSDAEIDALIYAEVTGAARRRAGIKAQQIAGERYIRAVNANAQTFHDQFEPIAYQLIENITAAAQDGNISLTELVRTGRTHEARLRADL